MYTNDFYKQQFSSNIDALNNLLQNVDQKLLNTIPAPKKWCIGEIIDHLLITGGRYLEELEPKLKSNPDALKKGSGPYNHPFTIRFLIKMVSPESQRNVPTAPAFEPQEELNYDKEKILSRFEAMNNRFLALVDLADEHQLDIGSIKVGNPLIPFWKMSISGCFAINEAHQRRHFTQIERILGADNQN